MRPILRKNRDTVTVIPVYRRLKRGDIVLFRRNDGMNVIHRIAKIKGETVVTLGDNCVYRDDPVNLSQVWGIAVSAVRDGKKIRLDSAVSRTFGILPLMVRPFRSLWLNFSGIICVPSEAQSRDRSRRVRAALSGRSPSCSGYRGPTCERGMQGQYRQ